MVAVKRYVYLCVQQTLLARFQSNMVHKCNKNPLYNPVITCQTFLRFDISIRNLPIFTNLVFIFSFFVCKTICVV